MMTKCMLSRNESNYINTLEERVKSYRKLTKLDNIKIELNSNKEIKIMLSINNL